jgi:DNA gyrase subunit A
MSFVPGPDLPGGGEILELANIREAYLSGRGTFKMRAKATIETVTARKKGIVITELPFNVGAERVIDRIKSLVESKKLKGISRVIDLTDGEKGLRLVIEVKSSHEPDELLAELYRLTPMEESFSINSVALVDGKPRTLGLAELLQVYLKHRLAVVTRRSEFRLNKANDRLHLVDGLLLAIVDIDKVIKIIRGSQDTQMAREKLIKTFKLSELQANYILEMPLRRLTKTSKIELEAEQAELNKSIAELKAILASDKKLKKIVSDELKEVSERFATPRRTTLLENE